MVCLLRSRGAPLWLAPYTVSGTAALYNYLEPRLELNKAAVLTVKVGSTAVADGDGEEEAGADRRLEVIPSKFGPCNSFETMKSRMMDHGSERGKVG